MKRKTLIFLIIFSLVSIGFLFSHGEAEEGIVIGSTVYTTQHEFYADVIKGMNEAADEAGARLVVTDANSSVTEQNNQIEDFTQQNMDAIITYGVDPVAIVPAVEAAIESGIPVVSCDMRLETDMVETFIGSDNVMLGEKAGEFAVEYINNELGGEAKIGVVTWLASVAQQERLKGFRSKVDQLPGAEIVATQDGDSREVAMSSAENIMQANPDIDLFYGTNEGSTIGAMSAVVSAGKTDQIKLVGIDISNDAIRGIENGYIIAVIAQQPTLLGRYAVESSMKVINGQDIDDRIVVPVKTVTEENVDEFKK